MNLPERYIDQITVDALNVLIWKLGMPYGYKTSDETAGFIIAELKDKNLTGLDWDSKNQQFVLK